MSNLDDAVGSAFDDMSDVPETPATPKVEEAVSEPTPEVEPTAEPKQQEESFSNVNPDTLPDELKGIYKSLLADYTRKRQAESKEKKDLTARVEELESRLKSQQTQSSAEPTVEGKPISPQEEIKQLARQTFIEEQESLWINQAKSDYLTLDDRLNENNPTDVYDEILDGWLQDKLDADVEVWKGEHGTYLGFDYKSRARELITQWDEYISSRNKKFIERQKVIAKEQTDKVSKQSPPVSSGKGEKVKGKMSLDEAANSAFDE